MCRLTPSFFLLLLMLTARPAAFAQPNVETTPIDAIVAVVGDGIVLESEVEAQAFAMRAQVAQSGQTGALTKVQRCNLLEELIFQKLLVHHAKLDSLEVTEAEVMDEIDLILVMTVNPGFGGQKFISSQIKKIAEIRQRIDDSGRQIDLQVDGGIDQTTAKLVVDAGANVLVAGTASFKDGPGAYAHNIDRLRVSP